MNCFDDPEFSAALKEASEFAATIAPCVIPPGHGTYRQKRLGLGVTIIGYDVDCSVEPHAMTVRYIPHVWRTVHDT